MGHTGKIAYAGAYGGHYSKTAADFLDRLEYLVNSNNLAFVLTDNGSEFKKDFDIACGKKNLARYYSRVRTPKDNSEVGRFNRTLIYEWLNDSQASKDINEFNRRLTDWLIIYNNVRPHQQLNYLTPLKYAEKYGLLSKRSSSSTASL